MIIKQLSIFLEDKTGRLTELTRILSENDINMTAFSVADAPDYGIMRLVVNKPELALKVLKDKGFAVNTTDVIALVVPNKPGGLHKALEILSTNNVAIDYMYAFGLEDSASVIIRPSAISQAIEVLQQHKMELISANQIYKI
ncbi:MAG: amino acid-binding protein [Bacteroidales bacterium]|nr:amino acid-binding protein [Bacteroidales bacterium]